MCVGRHLSADLLQMLTHGFAVGSWHDDGGTDCSIRTECAKQIDRVVTVIPHRPRTRTNGRPDVFQCSLLPHPGFILEPDLDRLTCRRSGQCLLHQAGEVFLNPASRTEKAQALDPAAQLAERGQYYWLQLTPRSWNAFCWMAVGLVATVSRWLGVIAVVMVLRATVARSASNVRKLWTGSACSVSPVVCL